MLTTWPSSSAGPSSSLGAAHVGNGPSVVNALGDASGASSKTASTTGSVGVDDLAVDDLVVDDLALDFFASGVCAVARSGFGDGVDGGGAGVGFDLDSDFGALFFDASFFGAPGFFRHAIAYAIPALYQLLNLPALPL